MYSAIVLEHFHNPRNVGTLDNPDRVGEEGTPGFGAFLVIQLALEDSKISDARYFTFGCGPAIAAGSLLTEFIRGKSLQDCAQLTTAWMVESLGGLPEDKVYCADLAISALRKALNAT